MKRNELVRLLEQNGWTFDREGGNHSVFTNGKDEEFVPRHNEVREGLARKIIKRRGLKK
jgi:mRNA interferase HicA